MIKKEELKIEPNPGTDDPSFFVKTENIEDDPFFKMYKIENTEDLKYPKVKLFSFKIPALHSFCDIYWTRYIAVNITKACCYQTRKRA